MAKITIIKKEVLELEIGMIFKTCENIYVLTAIGANKFVLANIETGKRYQYAQEIEEVAEMIEDEGIEYLGKGSEFKLVRKEGK